MPELLLEADVKIFKLVESQFIEQLQLVLFEPSNVRPLVA